MGTSERAWDAVWLTLFAAVLVGALNRLLPSTPAIQLAVVPAWLGYWGAIGLCRRARVFSFS